MRKILLSLITASTLVLGFSGCSEKNISNSGLMDDPVCPKLNKENISRDELEKAIDIKKEMVLNYEDIYSVYEDIISKYNDTNEPSRFLNEQNIEKINNTEIGGYLISLKMQKSNDNILYDNILDELKPENSTWCKKQNYISVIKDYKLLMRLR